MVLPSSWMILCVHCCSMLGNYELAWLHYCNHKWAAAAGVLLHVIHHSFIAVVVLMQKYIPLSRCSKIFLLPLNLSSVQTIAWEQDKH